MTAQLVCRLVPTMAAATSLARVAAVSAAAAAAAALLLLLLPRVRAALARAWEGDAALQHGQETLAVVQRNLAVLREALASACARAPAARRAAAAGVIADVNNCVDDLDLCLRASADSGSAAWKAARAHKRALLDSCAALAADAEAALA